MAIKLTCCSSINGTNLYDTGDGCTSLCPCSKIYHLQNMKKKCVCECHGKTQIDLAFLVKGTQGTPIRNAIKVAIKDVNEATDTLSAYTVSLYTVSYLTPAKVLAQTEQIYLRSPAMGMIGAAEAQDTLNAHALAWTYTLPMVSPFVGSTEIHTALHEKYLVRTCTADWGKMMGTKTLVMDNLGWKGLAAIYDKPDEFNLSLLKLSGLQACVLLHACSCDACALNPSQ